MADYIEGKRPVIEALRAQMPLISVLMADNVQQDSQIKDILRKAKQYDVPVSERGSHQGVMAHAKPYQYSSVTDILKIAERDAEKNNGAALVVLLDHITDAGNLGAIARSVDVIGASGLIIPGKRSASVTAATYKSSAGAINHVRCAQATNLASAIDRLKKAGFWVAGASEKAQHTVWEAPLYGKIALVMGNEAEGLARLTLEKCDFLVKLPQAGHVGSLNVAQACTAVMYEWMRQTTVRAAEGE